MGGGHCPITRICPEGILGVSQSDAVYSAAARECWALLLTFSTHSLQDAVFSQGMDQCVWQGEAVPHRLGTRWGSALGGCPAPGYLPGQGRHGL